MKGSSKPVQMACITIGFEDYLMPADKAMKVAEMMQSAFRCQKDFQDRGYVYTPGEQPRVVFAFVKTSEVRAPIAAPTQRQIGHRGER